MEAQADPPRRLEAQPLPPLDLDAGIGPRDVRRYHDGAGVTGRIRATVVLLGLSFLLTTIFAAISPALRHHLRLAKREYSQQHGNKKFSAVGIYYNGQHDAA